MCIIWIGFSIVGKKSIFVRMDGAYHTSLSSRSHGDEAGKQYSYH